MPIRFFLPLAMLLFFAAGCAGPVQPAGYLTDYSSFNRIDKKTLKLDAQSDEDFSLDPYFLTGEQREELAKDGLSVPSLEADGIAEDDFRPVLFIVEKPKWLASYRFEEEREEDVLFTIRERFYRYLLRQYPHPVRVRYAYIPDDPVVQGYRVVSLETAITDIKPGVGWLRYVIGYGAGTTVMQLEGRLVEGDKQLAEFAIREEHAGYPNMLLNTNVFSSTYCLKYAAEEAVGKLAPEIRKTIPAAVWREDAERSGLAQAKQLE